MKLYSTVYPIILNLCIIFEIHAKCTKYATTKLITTQSTTTESSCPIKNKISNFFGSYYEGEPISVFTVQVSDLSSLVVYSGTFLHAILFNFKNGRSELYGDDKNTGPYDNFYYIQEPYFKNPSLYYYNLTTRINLENKKIVAVYLRTGWWIDSIQFKILDVLTNTYTLTDQLGGNGGGPSSVEPNTLAPMSKNFEITSISGSVALGNLNIQTLQLSYSYCNPSQ